MCEISETAVFQMEVFDIPDILCRQFFPFGNNISVPEPAAGAISFEIFIDGVEEAADISGGEGDFSLLGGNAEIIGAGPDFRIVEAEFRLRSRGADALCQIGKDLTRNFLFSIQWNNFLRSS